MRRAPPVSYPVMRCTTCNSELHTPTCVACGTVNGSGRADRRAAFDPRLHTSHAPQVTTVPRTMRVFFFVAGAAVVLAAIAFAFVASTS